VSGRDIGASVRQRLLNKSPNRLDLRRRTATIPLVLSNGARSFVEAASAKSLANWSDSSPKSDSLLCRCFQR
jgi:hypothetical protein